MIDSERLVIFEWMKSPWKLSLLLLGGALLTVLIVLVTCALQHQSWSGYPSYAFSPASANEVYYVEDVDRALSHLETDPWNSVLVGLMRTRSRSNSENRTDRKRPASLTSRVRYFSEATVSRSGEKDFHVTGRVGYWLHTGARFGFGIALGQFSDSTLESRTYRGYTIYNTSFGGRDLYLSRVGPFIHISSKTSLMEEALRTQTGTDQWIHSSYGYFREMEQAQQTGSSGSSYDVLGWTSRTGLLDRAPVREGIHWFESGDVTSVRFSLQFDRNRLRVHGLGTVNEDHLDREVRRALRKDRSPLTPALSLIPRDALAVHTTRFPAPLARERFMAWINEVPVQGISTAIEEELTTIYSEMQPFAGDIDEIAKPLLERDLSSPFVTIISKEEMEDGTPSLGAGLLVRINENARQVLDHLNEALRQRNGRRGRKIGMTEVEVEGKTVYALKGEFGTALEELEPGYTVIDNHLFLSSSLPLIKRVIRQDQQSNEDLTNMWKDRLFAGNPNVRNSFYVNVREAAGHMEEMGGIIADRRMAGMSDRDIRREARRRVEEQTEDSLSPSRRNELVDEMYEKVKRERKKRIQSSIQQTAAAFQRIQSMRFGLLHSDPGGFQVQIEVTAVPIGS